MPNRAYLLLLAVLFALALGLPSAVRADNPTLTASVGPGFAISLKNADGTKVQHLDPGTYTIAVHDLGDTHNFHLFGPGVNQSTDIDFVGDVTWTVTFQDGVYHYVSDDYFTTMKGDFTVGTASQQPPPATKPAKLLATVGPGSSISLTTAAGARVRSVPAGAYTVIVRDRSSSDNFHLSGPGVDRKTGVAYKGTAAWKIAFAKGKAYRFRSDRHAALAGSFRAT